MRYNDLPSDAKKERVWVWTSGKGDSKAARSPIGKASPITSGPEQQSSVSQVFSSSLSPCTTKHGGRQPECERQHPQLCVTDWDFCVTPKQKAKRMLFVPTTTPASHYTLDCLSPRWVCPGLYLSAFPFLPYFPMRPVCNRCILALQSTAGVREKVG